MGGVASEVVGSLGFCSDLFDLPNPNSTHRHSRGHLLAPSLMTLGHFLLAFDS